MKKLNLILIAIIVIFISGNVYAQSEKPNLYSPARDAKKQIDSAIAVAAKEKKHVLLQVGGNWCSWCIMLHKFYASEPQVDSVLKAGYVVTYVNYSKENKNLDVLKTLGFPQRFGFPVLVILDDKGNRIHTQNSAYLEEGKGYNKQKVVDFLSAWAPSALNPEKYK